MIVLDTHAWAMFVDDPKHLGKASRRLVEKTDRVGISAMTVWEIALLVEKRRIALRTEFREWIHDALQEPRVELLPMTASVISMAHQLRGALAGDPFDRIIAATAVVEGCPLVTKDEKITESGVVPTVW